jgi:hypothetical protein
MSNASAEAVSERARAAAEARWGTRVLARSAAAVLERAALSESTRAELEGLTAKEDTGDE